MAVGVVRNIVLFIFILATLKTAKGESYICSIKVGGIKIGTLNASHLKINNIDYYSIVSRVEINLMMKIKVHYTTLSSYKDNKLMESTVVSLINGKRYQSKTLWNGNKYLINCSTYKYSYSDSSRTSPIYWSVSKLYFEKPRANSEVFAETYGKINVLTELNPNQFKFEIPKSKQIYKYDKNNSIESVEMINLIKNFEVIKHSK